MSGPGYLIRRGIRAVASIWVVFSIAFLSVSFTPNPNTVPGFGYVTKINGIQYYSQPPFAAQEGPLLDYYLDWGARILTLDLGRVPASEPTSANAVIGEALTFTAIYFIPALIVAVLGGTLIQLYAVSDVRALDQSTKLLGVLAVSIPSFIIAHFVEATIPVFLIVTYDRILELGYRIDQGPFSAQNLKAAVWPFLTMALYLFGIQLRYAGSELSEYVDDPFVKTARAKGASTWRIGLHILPHAAVHLVTAFFTDMLGMVLIGMYVIEWITDVPGFGTLSIDAVGARTPALIFAIVLIPVLIATFTNYCQDVYYEFIDPRVREE